MTSPVPGIAHRLQLRQKFNFLQEARAQYRSYLRGELSHLDIPGIIKEGLGVTTDVLCVVKEVLGIATDVLGDIMDFPRSIVHWLLYRDLAGRSAKITAGLVVRTR
jgi:hypothetical protein